MNALALLLAQIADVPAGSQDAALAAFSKEFWGLVILVLTGTGGAIVAVGRWLGGHIAEIQKSNAALIDSLQRDKITQRDEFITALDRREKAFTAIMEKRDAAFTAALLKLEDECNEQRNLDREQREEDRRALLRAIGLASGGDTGKFLPEPRSPKTRSRSTDEHEEKHREHG